MKSEAVLVARIVHRKSKAVRGRVYLWNDGDYGILWMSDLETEIDLESTEVLEDLDELSTFLADYFRGF